ncbi:hypothetical protein ADUPG1_013784 [Aduncisulcus paluster]|uniref:MutL-like protein 3 n=1 Tax=Aduncisulcus paluster TaxID=2918883 RepID=A0ABQ5K861_9EUKA|nr:hypothetical protein ADUPG1_013784 [Aduncisulcus paluster]
MSSCVMCKQHPILVHVSQRSLAIKRLTQWGFAFHVNEMPVKRKVKYEIVTPPSLKHLESQSISSINSPPPKLVAAHFLISQSEIISNTHKLSHSAHSLESLSSSKERDVDTAEMYTFTISHTPSVYGTVVHPSVAEEIVSNISDPHSVPSCPLPPSIFKIVAYRACLSSIVSGDTLSMDEMNTIIRQACECEFPFYCAHGRPVVVPLVRLVRTSLVPKITGK